MDHTTAPETQLTAARKGQISGAMLRVAARENVTAEFIRDEVARGRMIIPANVNHLAKRLDPTGIGKTVTTKVNVNLGNSQIVSGVELEVEKVRLAESLGADTIMDLSTGNMIREIRGVLSLAPSGGWPVPIVPGDIWQRLPQDDDELNAAAQACYGTTNLLAVAGSQAAIQALPMLRPPAQVALVAPSYAEHAHAWQRHGHQVIGVPATEILQTGMTAQVVVIVNPNNPTGKLFSVDELLHLHAQLAARGGWLVVDEAFIDATPEHSLASACPRPGLVVLRSLGKFFGLAGARVGFVLAEETILQALAELLGPWAIAAPSRHVATLALRDTAWQDATRKSLLPASQRLAELLNTHGLISPSSPAPLPQAGEGRNFGSSSLFQWVCCADAASVHQQLARQGILTRLYDAPSSLRFGLPRDEAQWVRLAEALSRMKR